MHNSKVVFGTRLALGFAIVLAAGVAQAQLSGAGNLAGVEKFKVGPNCGPSVKEAVSITFTVVANSFTAIANGNMYTGTLVPENAKQTKFTANFDVGSFDLLIDTLEDWAEDLCEIGVTVQSAGFTKNKLKVNKKRTKAKLALKLKATGFSAQSSGKAKYLLKAKGIFAGS